MQETYITHIRITEFATHSSTPPPPEARTPQNEKLRIIIVAVRKSGRVRMHKSKENANGTFSIGKTWNLDDLSRIQSFSGPSADPVQKQSAGETGFIVTIQKPYFWDAQTEKEKKFFIATLVKIYGKYTNGKAPELTGFDQRELDQIQGRRPPPPRPPPGEGIGQRNISGTPPTSAPSAPPQPLPPTSSPIRPPPLPTNTSSPAGSFDSTRSQAALRRLGANDKSQDSVPASLSPGRGDDSSSLPPRSRGGIAGPGALGRFGDIPPEPASDRPPERKRPPIDLMKPPQFADKDLVPAPLMSPMKKEPVLPPPRSAERMSPRKNSMSQTSEASSLRDRSVSQNDLRTKSSATSLRGAAQARAPPSNEPPLPRLKTPTPAESEDMRPGLGPMIRQRRAPLESPAKAPLSTPPNDISERDDTRPGLGPMRRQRNITPDIAAPEPLGERDDARPGSSPTMRTKKSVQEITTPPPPPVQEPDESRPGLGPMIRSKQSVTEMSSPQSPEESEERRPGLGPMIKNQKPKRDVAGSMWKAAAAAGAFKPRPGGAGERLRMVRNKSEEGPDGITGVVPAPPRPPSPEAPVPEAPEPPTQEDRTDSVPEVKVTVPDRTRPDSNQPVEKKQLPEIDTGPKEAPPQEEQRRAANAGNDVKYLATLGIDPALASMFLDNPKSEQLREWMNAAGFVPGEQMRGCTWDNMKMDLDRQLDQSQAGGWLTRFREDDERIDSIKGGLDQVILECEQLDDLLTLYSAGLGVGAHLRVYYSPKLLTVLTRPSRPTLTTWRRKQKESRFKSRTRRRYRRSFRCLRIPAH